MAIYDFFRDAARNAYSNMRGIFTVGNANTGKSPATAAKFGSQVVRSQLIRTRQDIADWQNALAMAESALVPNRSKLLDIYTMVEGDDTISSQIGQRIDTACAANYLLRKPSKEVDVEATAMLKKAIWFERCIAYILQARWFGHSLIELSGGAGTELTAELILRRHVIPERGEVKKQVYDQKGVAYRTTPEYGKYIVEFGDNFDLGLLNKCVPYALMKRFAFSSYSQFCEIHGMPIGKGKTQTDDPVLLSRMESMLREMGNAAFVIVDNEEDIDFIQGVTSDGEVYAKFIGLCNNALSLLLSGAIVGQDTKNGNYSKELASLSLLDQIKASDKRFIEKQVNTVLIPALEVLGILPKGLSFEYEVVEDLDALWAKTVQILPYFDVDAQFITDKFGIPVSPKQAAL